MNWVLFLLMTMPIMQDSSQVLKGSILTVYGIDGRPVNQSEHAQGKHTVVGDVTLSDGSAIITINTSTEAGKRSVGFINSGTYSGNAWVTDTSNDKTYTVYPLSGSQVMIKSSDTTDVSEVNFRLEGE